MPYKVFVAGEEALASDVNSLLMSQTVARFPTAAARTAAIAAPVKGQCTARDDGNSTVEQWDGGAWVVVGGVSYVFYRTWGAVVAGGTEVTYDLVITLPQTGSVIIEATAQISYSSGAAPNTIRFLVKPDGTGSWTIPTQVHDHAATISNNLAAVTIPTRALFTGFTRGQTITARFIVHNVGGGAAVTADRITGLIHFGNIGGTI